MLNQTTLRRFKKGRVEYQLLSGELSYDPKTGYLDLWTEDELPESIRGYGAVYRVQVRYIPYLTGV